MSNRPTIQSVSDTARWVAMYRAMESERPDALFHDPYARSLAGPQGEEILATLKGARRSAWPMVVRTAAIDEMVTRLVAEGVDTVVNLAAGLDTRPWRMDLPASLRWLDVDLPGISDYKRERLADAAPRCRLEMVTADLTDAAARDALFARAADGTRQVLVITEGLLVYLPPAVVEHLARALHRQRSFRWWITDFATPPIIKMMEKRWGKDLRAGNSPFQFAPAEGPAYFRPHGWDESEFRSMWLESLRLKRSVPFARFWAFVGRFASQARQKEMNRRAGIVLLARREATA